MSRGRADLVGASNEAQEPKTLMPWPRNMVSERFYNVLHAFNIF